MIRKTNWSSSACFSGERSGLANRTACESNTLCTSFSPFLNSVLPELTMSKIACAKPMPGAISTEPEIS